MESHYPAPV